MAAPDKAAKENIVNFQNTSKKKPELSGKSRNVSETEEAVDEKKIDINRKFERVYNLDEDVRRPLREAAVGEDGGRGGSPWPSESERAPAGRAEGQDTGSVPPQRPAAEWISGGAVLPRIPAEETGMSGPPAPEEMRWAEQADRVFRRDSRRYDGGFYLY